MAFQLSVKRDQTNVTVPIMVVDDTDGTPETGYAYNTAGIDLWYRRGPTGAETSITEATQTITGAHSDGGVVHISDGRGRLDLPDAAVASGVDWVEYGGTITGMVVIGGFITLESAASEAVRHMSESLYGNQHTIGATGNTTSAFHAEGIGLSADDDCKGEIFLLVDLSATPDLPVLVRCTGYTESTEVVACEQLDGSVIPFTPATGDYYFRIGQFTADVTKIAGVTQNATNLASATANYSATRGLTGTAVPNAAADAAGGLPISDAGGLDLDAKVGALTFTTANKVDCRVDNVAGTAQTAGDLAALVTTVDGNVDTLLAGLIPVDTTIATLASQTSFTLTAGSVDDDAYNGWMCVVQDASTAAQYAVGVVLDYTGSTKTVTLAAAPLATDYTMATTDKVRMLPPSVVHGINLNRVIGDGNATPWDGA